MAGYRHLSLGVGVGGGGVARKKELGGKGLWKIQSKLNVYSLAEYGDLLTLEKLVIYLTALRSSERG